MYVAFTFPAHPQEMEPSAAAVGVKVKEDPSISVALMRVIVAEMTPAVTVAALILLKFESATPKLVWMLVTLEAEGKTSFS